MYEVYYDFAVPFSWIWLPLKEMGLAFCVYSFLYLSSLEVEKHHSYSQKGLDPRSFRRIIIIFICFHSVIYPYSILDRYRYYDGLYRSGPLLLVEGPYQPGPPNRGDWFSVGEYQFSRGRSAEITFSDFKRLRKELPPGTELKIYFGKHMNTTQEWAILRIEVKW